MKDRSKALAMASKLKAEVGRRAKKGFMLLSQSEVEVCLRAIITDMNVIRKIQGHEPWVDEKDFDKEIPPLAKTLLSSKH